MKNQSILSICLLLIAIPMPAFGESFADNWHQWRGPHATGVSPTADPPVAWNEDENVKWKVAIEGQGTSTPIIWNDKVFVLTAINTGVKDPSIPDPEDQPKTNFFDICIGGKKIKAPEDGSLYSYLISRTKLYREPNGRPGQILFRLDVGNHDRRLRAAEKIHNWFAAQKRLRHVRDAGGGFM